MALRHTPLSNPNGDQNKVVHLVANNYKKFGQGLKTQQQQIDDALGHVSHSAKKDILETVNQNTGKEIILTPNGIARDSGFNPYEAERILEKEMAERKKQEIQKKENFEASLKSDSNKFTQNPDGSQKVQIDDWYRYGGKAAQSEVISKETPTKEETPVLEDHFSGTYAVANKDLTDLLETNLDISLQMKLSECHARLYDVYLKITDAIPLNESMRALIKKWMQEPITPLSDEMKTLLVHTAKFMKSNKYTNIYIKNAEQKLVINEKNVLSKLTEFSSFVDKIELVKAKNNQAFKTNNNKCLKTVTEINTQLTSLYDDKPPSETEDAAIICLLDTWELMLKLRLNDINKTYSSAYFSKESFIELAGLTPEDLSSVNWYQMRFETVKNAINTLISEAKEHMPFAIQQRYNTLLESETKNQSAHGLTPTRKELNTLIAKQLVENRLETNKQAKNAEEIAFMQKLENDFARIMEVVTTRTETLEKLQKCLEAKKFPLHSDYMAFLTHNKLNLHDSEQEDLLIKHRDALQAHNFSPEKLADLSQKIEVFKKKKKILADIKDDAEYFERELKNVENYYEQYCKAITQIYVYNTTQMEMTARISKISALISRLKESWNLDKVLTAYYTHIQNLSPEVKHVCERLLVFKNGLRMDKKSLTSLFETPWMSEEIRIRTSK